MTAAPNFSPDGDAAVLDKAIKAKGEFKVLVRKLWSVCEHASALQWVSVWSMTCWPFVVKTLTPSAGLHASLLLTVSLW